MENLVLYNTEYFKERIGRQYDGGYVICDLPKEYDCFISGGISNDISFEQAFLHKFPHIPCFAFDGTIPRLPAKDERIWFIRKNLGKEETDTLTNLHSVLAPFANIFMKIDIEGHEFRLFPTFSDEQMRKIKQLVVEIHTPADIKLHPTYFAGLSDVTHSDMFDLFAKFKRTHTLVHVHPNNGCLTHQVDGITLPNVFECTFIRNDFVNQRVPNSESLPFSIDMPNVPSKPIVRFTGYPFVNPK